MQMPDDLSAFNAELIRRYRAGEELPEPLHRERLALLTTTGRRTGEKHTAPMLFVPHGDAVLVIASADGAPEHPQWYLNLVDEPRVHLELPDTEHDADARVLAGAERAEVWAQLIADYPFFPDHQERAGRELPIVELTAV